MIAILDYTLRQIRGNNQPFGGLQLIFCGDMAQLPPSKSAVSHTCMHTVESLCGSVN